MIIGFQKIKKYRCVAIIGFQKIKIYRCVMIFGFQRIPKYRVVVIIGFQKIAKYGRWTFRIEQIEISIFKVIQIHQRKIHVDFKISMGLVISLCSDNRLPENRKISLCSDHRLPENRKYRCAVIIAS